MSEADEGTIKPDALSTEQLEEELTIAALGDEDDQQRDDRFHELLDERHHRDDPEDRDDPEE
jgi:hypothetical protein